MGKFVRHGRCLKAEPCCGLKLCLLPISRGVWLGEICLELCAAAEPSSGTWPGLGITVTLCDQIPCCWQDRNRPIIGIYCLAISQSVLSWRIFSCLWSSWSFLPCIPLCLHLCSSATLNVFFPLAIYCLQVFLECYFFPLEAPPNHIKYVFNLFFFFL